jgi:putative FmdB family regulatory protein
MLQKKDGKRLVKHYEGRSMPIYEYKCKKCDACFERLVFAGDEESIECPECGTRKVEKLMSCASFMDSKIAKACSSGTNSGFS